MASVLHNTILAADIQRETHVATPISRRVRSFSDAPDFSRDPTEESGASLNAPHPAWGKTTSTLRRLGLVFLALLLLPGCASMTPGQMTWVQPTSTAPHAGNVYLIRGWIGIFSYGINQLGDKLNAAGVRATVYQESQWTELADAIKAKYRGGVEHEPLILVGHSFGADDTLRVSKALADAGITVDLVVTLDPVTPPEVPGNVRRVCDLYQSHGAWDKLPAFRGVPLKLAEGSRAELQNLDVRKDRTDLLEPGTDHFNIEKKAKIHAEVLRQVLAVCPPRAVWEVAHGMTPPATPVYASQSAAARAPTAVPARVSSAKR